MKCPKCNYERVESDIEPEWQCPQCGIAVNKYRLIMEENTQNLKRFRQEGKDGELARKKLTITLYLSIPIMIIGFAAKYIAILSVLMWFLFSALFIYGAIQMNSLGYFLGTPVMTLKKREDHPFEFRMQVGICFFGSVVVAIIGIFNLLSYAF